MVNPSFAVLHYTCPPVVGGVELLIGTHARLLAEHGYPTRVIAGEGEPFHPGVQLEPVPLLYSKHPEVLAINEELNAGEVSRSFHAAVERIRDELLVALEGVDVCIAHNAFTLHFNLPLSAALRDLASGHAGPRFISWCHDLSWTNDLYIPAMRHAFPWSLLKTPVPGVRYVVVSETRRRELAGLFGVPAEDLTVVPAGVDPAAQLRLDPATAALVRRLRLLDSDLLMLAPVRITRRKNLELAMQITHALRQRGIRAKLVVTGPPGPHNVRSGEYVDELRTLRLQLNLEDGVVFLFEQGGSGEPVYRVSDRMVADLYALSDLLLFTSAQEGFGIPLLEAGLFRLPVFCSDLQVFREIGYDMVSYFGLDDKPAETAARIAGFMERDGVFRLRRRVTGSYSWEKVFADRIEPLLRGT